ncbi:putative membrane protein YeiH [Hydrogenimonas sp.]|nr:putative membrane protein YeiH [Hydrogenimonas sp.]
MMIAPVLIILGIIISMAARKSGAEAGKVKLVIPWFAVWFVVMSGINSLNIIPEAVVADINEVDTFLLTMAMTALGMETNAAKFKQAGIKPILLALLMFVWLLVGGYFVTKWAVALF